MTADLTTSTSSTDAPSVPGDWVLVPREPTRAMLEAGSADATGRGWLPNETVKLMWLDMLSAAPPAGGVAGVTDEMVERFRDAYRDARFRVQGLSYGTRNSSVRANEPHHSIEDARDGYRQLWRGPAGGEAEHKAMMDEIEKIVARRALEAALATAPRPEGQPGLRTPLRWYLGSMNDGLFIINTPPRPLNDDQFHDREDGPTLVLNINGLKDARAREVVGAHNKIIETLLAQVDRARRGQEFAVAKANEFSQMADDQRRRAEAAEQELARRSALDDEGWRLITADRVEWVVNDNAELGVKIGQQFFWLYKGRSLVYESGRHDDGRPMRWRHVYKREFGECCHPIDMDTVRAADRAGYVIKNVTEFDDTGKEPWADLPASPSPAHVERPGEKEGE